MGAGAELLVGHRCRGVVVDGVARGGDLRRGRDVIPVRQPGLPALWAGGRAGGGASGGHAATQVHQLAGCQRRGVAGGVAAAVHREVLAGGFHPDLGREGAARQRAEEKIAHAEGRADRGAVDSSRAGVQQGVRAGHTGDDQVAAAFLHIERFQVIGLTAVAGASPESDTPVVVTRVVDNLSGHAGRGRRPQAGRAVVEVEIGRRIDADAGQVIRERAGTRRRRPADRRDRDQRARRDQSERDISRSQHDGHPCS